MDDDKIVCGSTRLTLQEILEAARPRGIRFTEARKAYGSPRSVVSNTHGFRIAVHRVTGEIRILYSVQATDAGVIINPAQVRGQIEGGVAQGIGFALTENFHVDANGAMMNPNLRNYRIPTYADIPRTEVILVESSDSVGPLRSRAWRVLHQSGCPCIGERTAGCNRVTIPVTTAHPGTHLLRPEPMTANTSADSAATVIIGQRVRAGLEKEFEVWQKDLNRAAADYAGFLGAEIAAPTPTQPDWVIVYRFDSIAHVQAWINSATRQNYLDSGRQFFDGPATQQVVSGGIRPPDPLLTVVVTHRVGDDSIDEFLAWQDRLREVESAFDGFRGTELFRPVDGVQDEWTLLYRFDNAAHLDTWLTSLSDNNFSPRVASSTTSNCEPWTIRSAVGSPSTRTETRPLHLRRQKPRSRSGSVSTRLSSCLLWRCHR